MYERHRHGALSYGGGATLDGVVPHITCGEHAGHVGFQVVVTAVHGPIFGRTVVVRQVGAGYQLAGFIAHDANLCRPNSVGSAANADE